MSERRRRRPVRTAGLLVLTALAVVLGAVVSGWLLVAVPFTLTAACAAWLGLTDDELVHVFDEAMGDDLGRGPTGLSL